MFSSRWRLNHVTLSSLTVPFESNLEAEMARLAMDGGDEPNRQGFQKEFAVTGSILVVWVAEDLDILRVSINSSLERLSLVVRNIQRIRSLFPPSLGR